MYIPYCGYCRIYIINRMSRVASQIFLLAGETREVCPRAGSWWVRGLGIGRAWGLGFRVEGLGVRGLGFRGLGV